MFSTKSPQSMGWGKKDIQKGCLNRSGIAINGTIASCQLS